MNGMSISFTPDILAHARDGRISLSHDDVAAINLNINAVATFEGGRLTFDLGGPSADIGEVVEGMSKGYGKPAKKPAASTQTDGLNLPANATATQRAVAVNAAAKAGSDMLKQKQATDLLQTYGNPWKTNNKTHMAYITNVHPVLAKQLKKQAGVR